MLELESKLFNLIDLRSNELHFKGNIERKKSVIF